MEALTNLIAFLCALWDALGALLVFLLALTPLLPVGLWCAWWLWAVNWKKAWPVLAQGAWVPVLLLVFLSALVWSRIAPSQDMPNFWWQFGVVSALTALALLCGWLQGKLGWGPADVNFTAPAAAPHGHH